MDPQLTLFVGQTDPPRAPAPARAPRRRLGRNARMAVRLDDLARRADFEAEECRVAGDQIGERRAREQARDARRSAELLRAGPAGVARLLAS